MKHIFNNKTILNGTLFSIFSFFNQGVSFLLLILLAGYINPAEYGNLSLFNTIVQFLGYFIAFSTQGYLSVSYFQRGKQYLAQDLSTICYITIVVSLFLSVILLAFSGCLCKATGLTINLLWISIIISSFQIVFGLLLDYYRILERIGRYGLYSCAFAIINFALSIYLVIVKDQNWEGRIYAQVICTVVFGITAIAIFFRANLFTLSVDFENAKRIIIWGAPLIPHLASIWIKQGGDRFIINHYHTIDDVGLFSFALNLTSIIFMIGSAFNATNSVSIYQILSSKMAFEQKRLALKKQTKITLAIYIISTLLVVVAVSSFIPLILPKYATSIPYFLILSLQGFGQCLYFLYCNYLFYYHQNKKIMYVTFGTSLLHLCLSLTFTRYSLFLTCIIYVLVQVIIVSFIYNLSRKSLDLNLNKELC